MAEKTVLIDKQLTQFIVNNKWQTDAIAQSNWQAKRSPGQV